MRIKSNRETGSYTPEQLLSEVANLLKSTAKLSDLSTVISLFKYFNK